ncbi:MAG: 2-oxoglutarate oxidoreductase [Mogibacterium sp.]|nr:2-oxoglutarate oxidoreductase [Mogibacterium sp.]
METIYKRPALLNDKPFHYCPGCGHGIIHKLIAETLEELGIQDRTIGIGSIGCSVFITEYIDVDMIQPPHGRAPAAATAVKRILPDRIVFTVQGDGDLAGIGCGEINHAVARGEKVTTIFVNNTVFGMTGGQMAPTTLPGQKTTTTPLGRNPELNGNPIHVCEMLSTHRGAYYIARVSVDSVQAVRNAKKAIRKAFQYQVEGKGYCLVEVLSPCPTSWGMSPVQSAEYVRDVMTQEYPLGVFRDGGEQL